MPARGDFCSTGDYHTCSHILYQQCELEQPNEKSASTILHCHVECVWKQSTLANEHIYLSPRECGIVGLQESELRKEIEASKSRP
jgi:hypothetical protein